MLFLFRLAGLIRRAGGGLFPHHRINDGHDRNAYDHSQDAEQSAAHRDGEQHPDRRESHRGPHHTGIDQIAVDLLCNDNDNDKGDGMTRVHHQQDQRTGNRTHPGSHIGDHVGDADDNGDHHGVFQPADAHDTEDQHAQNERIRQLTADKVGEGGKGQSAVVRQPVIVFFGQEMPQNLPSLAAELVACGEDVDREDQPDEKVDHAADETACPGAERSHSVRDVGGQTHQLGAEHRRVDVVVLQEFEDLFAPAAVEELHDVVVVEHDVVPEVPDTGDKLRHDDPDNDAQQCEHQKVGTEYRHRSGRKAWELFPHTLKQLVDLTGGAVQDECNDQSDGDGAQDVKHIGQQSGEDLVLDEQERHQQQNNAAENDGRRPLLVDEVPLPDFFLFALRRIRTGSGLVWLVCHNGCLLVSLPLLLRRLRSPWRPWRNSRRRSFPHSRRSAQRRPRRFCSPGRMPLPAGWSLP